MNEGGPKTRQMYYDDALAFAQRAENQFLWIQVQIETMENYLAGEVSLRIPHRLEEFMVELENIKSHQHTLKNLKMLATKKFGLEIDEKELESDSLAIFCHQKGIEITF